MWQLWLCELQWGTVEMLECALVAGARPGGLAEAQGSNAGAGNCRGCEVWLQGPVGPLGAALMANVLPGDALH